MTKGVVILKALITKRRLKEICNAFDISYKFCHAVAKELKKPSYDLIKKLRFLIPTDFWFDEATKQFVEQIKENVNKED